MVKNKILMGGYGTLLLEESLNHSVNRISSAKERKIVEYFPVIVKGYQRLFNLHATHYHSSDAISNDNIEVAAANIRPSPQHDFNCLCFYINESELESIDKRERYYERVEVEFLAFDNQTSIGVGYVYMVNPETSRLLFNDNEKILPRWTDLTFTRTGAYRISTEFGEYYDKTTYMADGEVLVVDFYRQHNIAKEDILLK
ncbi:MAG: gamma-glutamylcyclotransferase family protein [Cyclobacteriaceae bacterium]